MDNAYSPEKVTAINIINSATPWPHFHVMSKRFSNVTCMMQPPISIFLSPKFLMDPDIVRWPISPSHNLNVLRSACQRKSPINEKMTHLMAMKNKIYSMYNHTLIDEVNFPAWTLCDFRQYRGPNAC